MATDEKEKIVSRNSTGNVAGRLENKIAVITGAAAGQGREVALLFARAGARVVGCDINAADLAATAELANREGLQLDLRIVDATDQIEVVTWIDEAATRYGGIDILYNNCASAQFAPFADMTLKQWQETLQRELDVVFIPSQAVWRHMIARGGGSIINIASVFGMRGCEPVAGMGLAAHAAGKGGVIGFTNQLAVEGAPHWIRANCISPGPILTETTRGEVEQHSDFRRLFEGIPLLNRAGFPPDVAYAGLYLASDESSFVTGVNLPVDGGVCCKVGGLVIPKV